MNGVDIADHVQCLIPIHTGKHQVVAQVFFWLIETCITNSYALYKEIQQKPMRHITYHHSIFEALASRYISSTPARPRIGRPRKRSHPDSHDPECLNGQLHLLDKQQQHECVVCSHPASGQRHRTVYYCKTCPDNTSLCPDKCFERYHTLTNYKLQTLLVFPHPLDRLHPLAFVNLYC